MKANLQTPAWAWVALGLLLLPGCARDPSIYGLRPVSPPQRMGPVMSESYDKLEYPVVASNPPLLEWEAFIPPRHLTADDTPPCRITYDLRIWETNRGLSPTHLVYAKTALPAPSHQLEHGLKIGTAYFWSVRARLECAGETRLTDWSSSLRPTTSCTKPNRPGEIPDANYFRFVTPGTQNYEYVSDLTIWKELIQSPMPKFQFSQG